VNSDGTWRSALVDTGASFVTIDTKLVAEAGLRADATIEMIRVNTANGALDVAKIVLPNLWVGPVLVLRVEVVVCDACGMLIGQCLLSRFDLSTRRKDGIEFLDSAEDSRRQGLSPRSAKSRRGGRNWLRVRRVF
jgi:clan AA aspartic protease (TIGR02281 family)